MHIVIFIILVVCVAGAGSILEAPRGQNRTTALDLILSNPLPNHTDERVAVVVIGGLVLVIIALLIQSYRFSRLRENNLRLEAAAKKLGQQMHHRVNLNVPVDTSPDATAHLEDHFARAFPARDLVDPQERAYQAILAALEDAEKTAENRRDDAAQIDIEAARARLAQLRTELEEQKSRSAMVKASVAEMERMRDEAKRLLDGFRADDGNSVGKHVEDLAKAVRDMQNALDQIENRVEPLPKLREQLVQIGDTLQKHVSDSNGTLAILREAERMLERARARMKELKPGDNQTPDIIARFTTLAKDIASVEGSADKIDLDTLRERAAAMLARAVGLYALVTGRDPQPQEQPQAARPTAVR